MTAPVHINTQPHSIIVLVLYILRVAQLHKIASFYAADFGHSIKISNCTTHDLSSGIEYRQISF